MTTKYIFDTKSIMSSAWEYARKSFARSDNNRSLRQCFAIALELEWEDAIADKKEAIEHDLYVEKAIHQRKKYIELASVAEQNQLNHGKAWQCTYRKPLFVDALLFDPPCAWEGKLICYVYPR